MKKIFILVTLFACLIHNKAKADYIVIKGDTLWTIFSSPFDKYPDIVNLRYQLKDYSTDCTEDNCSFLSTWKIVNNRLTLAKIENCWCNSKKQTANLKNLFGDRLKDGPMYADWYTGEIWVTKDKPNSWGGMFAASWPSETRLMVEKGIVTSIKNFVYPKPVISVYYQHPDSLNKFVATHINWAKIHNQPHQVRRAYFLFGQDANGYITNIQFARNPLTNQTFDKEEMVEIGRVLGLLQWPLYYYHGKPVRSFRGIDFVLSDEMKDKYGKGD